MTSQELDKTIEEATRSLIRRAVPQELWERGYHHVTAPLSKERAKYLRDWYKNHYYLWTGEDLGIALTEERRCQSQSEA